MRPSLGMTKLEYSHKARLKQCLPARLREASIHSGFYTTSNVGLQRKLGFSELWSSMADFLNSTLGRQTRGARKRAKKRLRWPASPSPNPNPHPNPNPNPNPNQASWWRQSSAALLHGRADGQYNWLGDHDYFGLPKARDFIAARGERRFFLHLMAVSSHHPFVGVCPSPNGAPPLS